MSTIRTVAVAVAVSLFGAAIVTGLVVALAANVPAAVRTASTSDSSHVVVVAAGNPTTQDRPTAVEPIAPTAPGAPGDEGGSGGTDGGTGTPDDGGTIPPLPSVPLPRFGAAAEITWLGATPYPAMCGGSFTIFADTWDDVGVVSATASVNGIDYPMSTSTGANWYVVVPVPAGAELVGGVLFTVQISDGDGMGMWSQSQVNVTC